MKVGIFSDLHLEFRTSNIEMLTELVKKDPCDILINAGDTHPEWDRRHEFNIQMPDHYYDVLGNHDFYGDELYRHRWIARVGTTKIAGATLWTDFNGNKPICRGRFPKVMIDCRMIVNDETIGQTLIESIFKIHGEDLTFIEAAKPDIVVTHHAPSYKSIHPIYHKYGEDNYFFCSDLDQFILDNPNIKLWIHGHVHSPFDYTIGNCRVVCNPLAYPGERFKRDEDYTTQIIDL